MKKQYAFYFDSSRCSGCKTCQVACKDKNNLDVGVIWRRVYEVSKGEWIKRNEAWIHNLNVYNMSVACNHCEEPVCVEVCPTKAMHKTKGGIVIIDEKKCIGCKYCEWACPYGSPQYDDQKGVMTKCNFCIDYLEDDKNPSCVDACPMRVLDFGELSEMKKKYGDNVASFPLPDDKYTEPALIVLPHKDVIDSNDKSARVSNKEEV